MTKPKPYLLDNKYKIVPAFEWKGETYFMFEDAMNIATGRGLTSLMYIEELQMRCSVDYLKAHVEACDKIFSDPKKIDLQQLMRYNMNLKERINFLVAIPNHVFKLASVVFFTKEESPYHYNAEFNKGKIKAWSEEPEMLNFFFQTPLKDLIPFLALPESNSETYFRVVEKIQDMHLRDLLKNTSKSLSTIDL